MLLVFTAATTIIKNVYNVVLFSDVIMVSQQNEALGTVVLDATRLSRFSKLPRPKRKPVKIRYEKDPRTVL
jgi:hypothetical protein